jgi:hypothetical protein
MERRQGVAARALSGGWQDRRWFAVRGEDAREAQGHPRVGGLVTVDGAPGAAVGLHDLSHGRLLFFEQEIAGSDHLAGDEGVEAAKVIKDLFP